jgi:hypothetical protein
MASPRAFAVTWDYRCPFARNAHEHLVAGLEAGAPWEVDFLPFSLNQAHVAEGEPAVWDNPEQRPALLAMLAGITVRDRFPEQFNRAHLALFAARHDQALDIREEAVLRDALRGAGVDADEVFAHIATGAPLEVFRESHERAVDEHGVFGVPTFIVDGQAVFVRVMHRPGEDPAEGRRTIERILHLTAWPELNEFKHTRIAR